MESLSFRKIAGASEKDKRSRILRGIYEENLAIQDLPGTLRRKAVQGHSWRWRRWLLPMAFLMLLSGLALPVLMRQEAPVTIVVNSVGPRPLPRPIGRVDNVNEVQSLKVRDDIPLSQMLNLGIRRIVVDAGHGGSDNGTIGKGGIREKDVTLAVAQKLRARLLQLGIGEVVMTRTQDKAVSLQERVEFAKKAKTDMFISIHVNSLPNSPRNVIETFYFGPSEDKSTLRLANLENQGAQHGLSDFKEIVERLGAAMKLQESRKLAEAIQKDLYRSGLELDPAVINTGVKKAPFVVLLGLDVPSVLAEIACMSNAKAEKYLTVSENQELIAASIAAGVISYQNRGSIKNERK